MADIQAERKKSCKKEKRKAHVESMVHVEECMRFEKKCHVLYFEKKCHVLYFAQRWCDTFDTLYEDKQLEQQLLIS